MSYESGDREGHEISGDPFFTLMAGADGVGYVRCGDSVLVVPMTQDNQVLLAVERSPAFGVEVLGLVGGSLETDESLEEAANRELQEEAGWRAERIDYLGELHPFKYLTSRQFVFMARDLSPARLDGDERWPVRVRKVALDGYLALCAAGELHDSSAIAALCLAQEFLGKERA